MPDISINHVMLCEDLRQELYGKFTIVGFYGHTPHVRILVGELDKPVARLVVVASVTGDPGNYELVFQILGPDKDVRKSTNLSEMQVSREAVALNAIDISGFKAGKAGEYSIQFLHNDKLISNNTLHIEQAERPQKPGLASAAKRRK